jgi:hypothetical protein
VVASRHGTILPSYQIHPSRSAIDMTSLLAWRLPLKKARFYAFAGSRLAQTARDRHNRSITLTYISILPEAEAMST